MTDKRIVTPEIPLLVILGPTASGKTTLATRVAAKLNGEIISADSRQVYRGMDIGTGKDLDSYEVNGVRIPFHLMDIMEAGERYNLSCYQNDFHNAYLRIVKNDRVPVVCGGTGLYIDAVLKNYTFTSIPVNEPLRQDLEKFSDEELLKKFGSFETSYRDLADTSTRKRLIRAIEISFFLNEGQQQNSPLHSGYRYLCFGLNPPVEVRREKISRRLNERLMHGLIEEVQQLLASGITADQLIYYGLEYKYVTQYLTGVLGFPEMSVKLETEIHRFAKRQMTFFRKMERDGIIIRWLDFGITEQEQTEEVVRSYKSFN